MLNRQYRSLANSPVGWTPSSVPAVGPGGGGQPNTLQPGPITDQDSFPYDNSGRMLTAVKGRFISRLARDVKRIAPAVRRHCRLSHTCHGCLDVTDREDESRIRAARLRENFAWLNRCSLSLLKPHSAGKSLALQRRRRWNFDTLLKVLDAQRTECALALPREV